MYRRLTAPIGSGLVAFAALLTLLVSIPAKATLSADSQSKWAIGVVGGGTDGVNIVTRRSFGTRYPVLASGAAFAAVHLLRDLGGHFSIIGQATYLSFGPGYDSYRVLHVPVGVGARYRFVTGSTHQGSPYVEITPGIAWSQWQAPFDRNIQTSVRPALIAGLGAHGKVGGKWELDIGLRYFLTADGEETRQGSMISERPEGLNQVGAAVGLYYAL